LAQGLAQSSLKVFFSAGISELNLSSLQRAGAAALIGGLWKWEESAPARPQRSEGGA